MIPLYSANRPDISKFTIPFPCYLVYGEHEQAVRVKVRPHPVSVVIRSADNKRSFEIKVRDILDTSTATLPVIPEGKGRNKIRPLNVVVFRLQKGDILLSGNNVTALKEFIDLSIKYPIYYSSNKINETSGIGRITEGPNVEKISGGYNIHPPMIDGIDDDIVPSDVAKDYYQDDMNFQKSEIPHNDYNISNQGGNVPKQAEEKTSKGINQEDYSIPQEQKKIHDIDGLHISSPSSSSSDFPNEMSDLIEDKDSKLISSISTFLPSRFIIVEIFKGDALIKALEEMGCIIIETKKEHGSAILKHTVLTGIPYPKYVNCTQILTNIKRPIRSITSHVSATGHKWASWMEAEWRFDIHPQQEGTRVDLHYKCIRKARRPVKMVSRLVLGFVQEAERRTFIILEQRHREALIRRKERIEKEKEDILMKEKEEEETQKQGDVISTDSDIASTDSPNDELLPRYNIIDSKRGKNPETDTSNTTNALVPTEINQNEDREDSRTRNYMKDEDIQTTLDNYLNNGNNVDINNLRDKNKIGIMGKEATKQILTLLIILITTLLLRGGDSNNNNRRDEPDDFGV